MRDAVEQFREAIRSAGLIPPDVIERGKFHKFPGEGKRNGNTAAWCKLFPDGMGGIYGDYSSGLSTDWHANRETPYTPAEREAFKRQVAEAKAQCEAERKAKQAEAASKAAATWRAAKPAPQDHPYLVKKGIKPSGARLHGDALIIAMRADGKLHSLQFIAPDGEKRFLSGGRVTGGFFSIGNPNGAAAVCIAEGFATGATIHEATSYPVAVAFNAGNLGPVAKAMHERFADLTIILCADDDVATEGNPGITKATEAARSVGGKLAIPTFDANRPDGVTDFNDMATLHGLEAVKHAVEDATVASVTVATGWEKPQPLLSKVAAEPYPVDALPDTIRAAVEEVQGFVKAPVALVASSAMSALSLAAQGHADVKRAEKLTGPIGLYLLTIAESGERKSTCDTFFIKAIREYEETQREAAEPGLKDYRAAIATWEAKHNGVKDKIRQDTKSKKPTASLESDLRDLEYEKPQPPKVPQLLYADVTPEALAYELAKHWPCGGIISAEGGTVFGSHGMGKDSVSRNLSLLNQLWDAAPVNISRKTSESFAVRGARLTIGLQVQENPLREFLDRSGPLARGSGFLARFLVAWPESTQGTRLFTEAPDCWPALSAFHKRIAGILEKPAPMDDRGLTPTLMTLAPETKAAWVAFHDVIEGELATDGELHDVRDVASKAADNAVRMATQFQIFEHGLGGSVGLDCFESASRIVAWHLNESRRFFGELALPVELANAARLDSWLIDYCRRNRTHLVPTREAQRLGPVRDKQRLETALRELEDTDRVIVSQEGRRRIIKINPALVL